MAILIDLDKSRSVPNLCEINDKITIKLNNKIVVKDSILENIDTISLQDLEFILIHFKDHIDPIMTSSYIPKSSTMRLVQRLAPKFKVRFKTERPGCAPLNPITMEEFFMGEEIYDKALKGIRDDWSDIEKFKYVYNCTALLLSYDLAAVTYENGNSEHEKYARNIFTAVTKNYAICSTFAHCCDYLCYRAGLESEIISEAEHDYLVFTSDEIGDFLGDPTFDSTSIKFGIKPCNFGVSKEQFAANHNLEETDTDEYTFESIDEKSVEEIDRKIGYLRDFDDSYTDDYVYNLGKNLDGDDIFDRVICFLDRVCALKTVGRTGVNDYLTIIRRILDRTEDLDFVDKIRVYPFTDGENTLRLGVEVTDNKVTKLYGFGEDFHSFKEMEEKEITKSI